MNLPFAVLTLCVLVSVTAGIAVGGGAHGCADDMTAHEIGDGVVCAPDGVPPLAVPEADGQTRSLFWSDFGRREGADAPWGTIDLTITAHPFVLRPDARTELPSTRVWRDGPFTFVHPEELTFLGGPIVLRCRPSLFPPARDAGAEICSLLAALTDQLTIELTLHTVTWAGRPSWPAFNADFADTWPAPLRRLEADIVQFLDLPS